MIRLWILAAAISLLSAPASASTITFEGVDFARGGYLWFRIDGTNTQAYAGIIRISVDDDPLLRSVVCADLFTAIELGDEVDVNETRWLACDVQRGSS